MPVSQVPFAGISNPVDFRNIVINGNMQIAQRATSVASITTDAYHTVDRFLTTINTLGTWTQSQSTDVPTGQGFANSFKMDCTTADASPGAADYLFIRQLFEGQNLQYLKKGTANASPLTASFWVKSTKTGTFIVQLLDQDNNRSVSKSYTVNVTNTWEFKTITFPGDTTGAFDNNNEASLQLRFWLGAGSNYTSGTLNTTWETGVSANTAVGQVNVADSTANDWLITGVQLEAGEQASGFEFMPIDVNLNRCYRYFELETTASGGIITVSQAYSTSASLGYKQYKIIKRAAPTISYTGTAVSLRADTNSGGGTLAFEQISVDNCRANITSASNLVAGNASAIYANGTEIKISYSAEL